MPHSASHCVSKAVAIKRGETGVPRRPRVSGCRSVENFRPDVGGLGGIREQSSARGVPGLLAVPQHISRAHLAAPQAAEERTGGLAGVPLLGCSSGWRSAACLRPGQRVSGGVREASAVAGARLARTPSSRGTATRLTVQVNCTAQTLSAKALGNNA